MTVEEHPELGRYMVNSSTKEIHDTHTIRSACNTALMLEDSSNVRRVGLKVFKALLREGFDLCDHCFDELEGAN